MSVKGFTVTDVANNLLNAVESDDEKAAMRHAIILLGGAAINLETIANAVEKLSNFNLTRIGDVVFGSTEQTTGLDLTPEETETIEALRRGDIMVVPCS